MSIKHNTHALDEAFADLEHYFNTLPSNTKRYALRDDDCHLLSSLPSPPPVQSEGTAGMPLPPPTGQDGEHTINIESVDDNNLADSQVKEFHIKADHVQSILHTMQSLVRTKQPAVDEAPQRKCVSSIQVVGLPIVV